MEDSLPLCKDMTRIVFIRHGQSQANLESRFAGHLDVPLTELGRTQARLAADYIVKREKIDKIYSSDLSRAYDTALEASKLTDLPITTAKELREICSGVWQGRLVSEIEVEYAKEYYTWRHDYANARLPQGESVAEVYNRVVTFVKQKARENDGLTLLFASHASPMRAVECASHGWGYERMAEIKFMNNSSISIYEYDSSTDALTLIERNITEHLDPSKMSYVPKGLQN